MLRKRSCSMLRLEHDLRGKMDGGASVTSVPREHPGVGPAIESGRLGVWAGLSSDPIADAVHQAICEGRLPAGTRLGEEELCRIFGVSRTLVRQALQRL